MKEQDIRPQALMQKYVELIEKDVKHYFSGSSKQNLPCVACGSENVEKQFSKQGFGYVICGECGTLYQTPRPSVDAFELFYRDSESSRYWAEVFYPSVAEVRREKIFKPRVQRLNAMCDDIGLNVSKLIDVGAGNGTFLDEWRVINPDTDLLAIEPSILHSEECRKKRLNVVESSAENVIGYDGYADLVVCFEVLEHVDNPLEFVKVLKRLVRPGGYLFLSTLCIDGFDLQMLWEQSSQISPPQHINFHSVKGFKSLFQRAGLIDVVITTPGQLDVDIVKNFAHNNPDLMQGSRFLKSLMEDEEKSISFQQFLSANQLSSHAWVFSKKPEEEIVHE
jgi:SAM-dependent methyltransferase